MTVGSGHYAVLSALLFAIGVFGAVSRRDGLSLLTSMAVMFLGPVVALVGFSEVGRGPGGSPAGSAFALLAVSAVVAQLIVGTAVLVLIWRRRQGIELDDLDDLSA